MSNSHAINHLITFTQLRFRIMVFPLILRRDFVDTVHTFLPSILAYSTLIPDLILICSQLLKANTF